MRLVTCLIIFLGFVSPSIAANDGPTQLLNSTLITRLHLDPTDRQGQMVGAYQASFRNTSGAPISSITLLLNPSLRYTKVVGSGGSLLTAPSNVTAIAGYELLELNVAKVQLPEPLDAGKRTEIVVHYKGYLTNMTYMAVEGVKETLHPNFAMIRADSFGYPVFAEASRSSINAAFAHKPFQQVVFIDYPGANEIAGSLNVADKSQSGGMTKVEMKSSTPTGLFAAAIAPYSHLEAGPVKVSFLQGSTASAQNFLLLASQEAKRIESLLGAPSAGSEIRMVEVPTGYASRETERAFFRENRFFDADMLEPAIKSAILDLWKSSGSGASGHWSNGLDAFVQTAVSAPENVSAFQNSTFAASQKLFESDKKMGKTSLADYTVEGFSSQSDTISALAYGALYSLLGPDEFFKFVKQMRTEFAGEYVDAESVADFMKATLKNKAAKKFAKNWFSSGRAGKDMAKAKSFENLVSRYK